MLTKLLFASTCALASLCFFSQRSLAQLQWTCFTDGLNQAYGSTQQEAYNNSLSICARNSLPAAGVPSPCQPQNVVCNQTGLFPPQPPQTQPPSQEPVPPVTNGTLVGIPSIAADFQLQLWAFARDKDGRILYATADNNWNWTDWREIPGYGRTSFAPAVTVWNNRLVVLIRGQGDDGRIYINQVNEEGNWNLTWNEVPGDGRTSAAPAVTIFQSRLVVLIRGQGDDGRIYITQTDRNWNWNTIWNELPGNGRTAVAPAITVFNNRLVALIRGQGDDGQIYISQSDSSWRWNPTWSIVPGNGRTSAAPAITVFNNRLVVLIRGQLDDGRIYITQTDANWNWNTKWNEVPGNGRTEASPAVAVFKGQFSNASLVSLVRGAGSDERIYVTQTDANWNWNSTWNIVPNVSR